MRPRDLTCIYIYIYACKHSGTGICVLAQQFLILSNAYEGTVGNDNVNDSMYVNNSDKPQLAGGDGWKQSYVPHREVNVPVR